MKKFKHLLVALDHSQMDDVLIRYTSFFASYTKMKKVYFVHNIKKHDSDEIFDSIIPPDTLLGDTKKEILEKIQTNYTGKTDYEVIVSNEVSTDNFISYNVLRYKIDLTILGKKNHTDGSGTLTGKLLRSLKCSILLIPNHSKEQFNKILVGTDFSAIALRATRIAFKLKTQTSEVDFAHIYSIPKHYLPFLNEEKIIQMTEQHANQQLEKFIKKTKIDASYTSFYKINRKENNIAVCLQKFADENHYDLLIIGDKGQNRLSSFLIGSVVEQLYNINFKTPVLVVK
ncbi:MAG: universal stress protein [Flavobacteriales bacterium]